MTESKLNPFAKHTTIVKDPVIKDVFGRPLHEGDQVLLQTGMMQPFIVTKCAPVVDPGQPANLMDITVSCTLRFRAVREERAQEFVRVMEASENPHLQKTEGAN